MDTGAEMEPFTFIASLPLTTSDLRDYGECASVYLRASEQLFNKNTGVGKDAFAGVLTQRAVIHRDSIYLRPVLNMPNNIVE